jgi:hypothetical protein
MDIVVERFFGDRCIRPISIDTTVASYLGCAFLQESPESPGICRNLGSKKKELRSFFAGTSRKSRTDREGMLKNTFLFCRNPFLLATVGTRV